MIKIVLPFLLIGKALKPLAKIKRQSWKAMGSAFGQMKSAVDPMKSFGKIMEILNVVMLPLTYIVTLLAAVIIGKLMPHIIELIDYIDDLNIALEEQAWWNKSGIDYINEDAIPALQRWYENLHIWFDGWDQRQTDFFKAWDEGLDDIYGWFEDLINDIKDLLTLDLRGGGGGGGGGGGDDGFEWPEFEWGTGPVGGGTNYNTTNSVNINLSNAVIDNRAKLVRDISEEVIIRLG